MRTFWMAATALGLALAGPAWADTVHRECDRTSCITSITTSTGNQITCTLPGNGHQWVLRGGVEKPATKPVKAYCFGYGPELPAYTEVPYQNGWPINFGTYGRIIGLKCQGNEQYEVLCDWPPYAQATTDLEARRRHAAGED